MPKGNSLDIINSNNPLLGDLDFTASSHHVLVPTATTGDQVLNYNNLTPYSTSSTIASNYYNKT